MVNYFSFLDEVWHCIDLRPCLYLFEKDDLIFSLQFVCLIKESKIYGSTYNLILVKVKKYFLSLYKFDQKRSSLKVTF